jgi:superfamily I DNA/RNA helicase
LVVEKAQTYAPEFKAAPTAPEGTIRNLPYEDLSKEIVSGDVVLSRTNAALAKTCMQLLRCGIRARIEGRDIGQRLCTIVEKIAKKKYTLNITDFLPLLVAWRTREVENAEAAEQEARAALVIDQAETIMVLAEETNTVGDLLSKIENMFGDVARQNGMVVLSTVHKAKGLEWNRVYLLECTFSKVLKHPRCNKGEENNIYYVAITRSKSELVHVDGEV